MLYFRLLQQEARFGVTGQTPFEPKCYNDHMSTTKLYPAHLYEQTRIQVANTYFKREFRKYFHSLRDSASWEIIDNDIDNWFSDEEFSGVNGPRDFWDGFFGFATGFKLKNGLLEVITAENIQWTEEILKLDDSITTGGNMLYIDERLSASRLSAEYLRTFFTEPANQKLADEWKQKFSDHENISTKRDQFPITVEEQEYEGKKILSTYDGNRRLIKAILNGDDSICAFVARYSSHHQNPKNYWISTSFLIQMIMMAKKIDTEESYQATLLLLKEYVKQSEAGAIELRERALWGSNETVKRLKKDLGFID